MTLISKKPRRRRSAPKPWFRPGKPWPRTAKLWVAWMAVGVVAAVLVLVLDATRIWAARELLTDRINMVAVATVSELDGTAAGIRRARAVAARAARERSVQLHSLEFSEAMEGPWRAAVSSPLDTVMVRVSALSPAKLGPAGWLLGDSAANIWAVTVAHLRDKTNFTSGLFPYSPIAPASRGASFGLKTGEVYTLRWAEKPSLEDGNVCPGDRVPETVRLARTGRVQPVGFLEFTNPNNIRRSIVNDNQTATRTVGEGLMLTAGFKGLEHEAIVERILQDKDSSSPTFREYRAAGRGNGRRLVAAAIHDHAAGNPIVAVGAFFLLPAERYTSEGDQPFCAEFVGAYSEGRPHQAPGSIGYRAPVIARMY